MCRLDCFEMVTYNEYSDKVKNGGMLTTKRRDCIISGVGITILFQEDLQMQIS